MLYRFYFTIALTLCSLMTAPAWCSEGGSALSHLAPRNTEVPFAWLPGATRAWPILRENFPVGARMTFEARRDGRSLGQGNPITLPGLTIGLDREQQLSISAAPDATMAPFSLEVSLTLPGGALEAQTLQIQPGPPARPISYIADFGDDIIRIFNRPDGTWRPVEKDAFDQYFRRCQLQGLSRLILWLGPMPYITDPENYAEEDWARYEAQARAMTEGEALQALIAGQRAQVEESQWGRHIPWDWIRELNTYRLLRDFGPLLSRSAEQHGIRLTVSFRPFEPALTKYYEIPAFDEAGAFLWSFLPMATPTLNYQTAETGFAHYRTILREMGREDRGRIGRITIPETAGASDFVARFNATGDNLRIHATDYPPLQQDSLVLQRREDGSFAMVPFSDFAEAAKARLEEIRGFTVRHDGEGVHIEGLEVPFERRFLILSNPSDAPESLEVPALAPVQLYARAGNRIGRENVYWVLAGDPALEKVTRVPGIGPTGEQATTFNATESGYQHLYRQGLERLPLRGHQLVIDLGAPWSVEMMDLQRPRMRENVVRELKTILDLPAFDEIYISTRSHVQLAAYQGDGADGIGPLVAYREARKHYNHLGIDRAYAPVSLAQDPQLRAWAEDPTEVERITLWQPGEWEGDCQGGPSPFRWRQARNEAVAGGVRSLLEDLEQAFPGVRTRIVVPMNAAATATVRDEIANLKRPDGTPYGLENQSGVWSTINRIHSIGEGMAMVDLTGLSTEPVLFGIRDVPDPGPFDVYLRGLFRDLADNRGSAFRGPRSFFFEAQYTLRRTDYERARAEREALIGMVLSHGDEVNEVILYEAADWLYYLPFDDPTLSGHGFLSDPGHAAAEHESTGEKLHTIR